MQRHFAKMLNLPNIKVKIEFTQYQSEKRRSWHPCVVSKST